jgi:tRNA G10  N-methylase Trm11
MLGRNPKLSEAEIFSYFEKKNLLAKFCAMKSNCLIVETAKLIDTAKTTKALGGTIAIGKTFFTGNLKEILKSIAKEEVYFGKDIKFKYFIISLAEQEKSDEIFYALKNKFKEEGLKAQCHALRGTIKIQDGGIALGSPSKIKNLETTYFFLKEKENLYSFGCLEAKCDLKETENRDMGKPERRESLAISPRLAKILINLAQVREKQNLLDPFCGVGVILQEALIQRINAFGIDIDFEAVKKAEKNINWLKKTNALCADFRIIGADSKKVELNNSCVFDGIATEPYLGGLLKTLPKENEAVHTISKFEELMIGVINNLKKYLKKESKIVFTAPLIKTSQRKIFCDISKICAKTGFVLYSLQNNSRVNFPLQEFREDQIVGREIYVLSF